MLVQDEAGDKLLQFVASKFKKYYGDAHTYQIRGDEFVTFIIDKEESEVKK